MKKQIFLLPLLILSLVFTGCSDDDDHDDHSHPVNEQEVITTVEVTLSDGDNTYVLSWEDLDGDGPDEAVVTGGTMPAGVYDGFIQLLNKTVEQFNADGSLNEEYYVTLEILEEDLDHQFFFNSINGLDVTAIYTDMDSEGNPIGQQFGLVAANTGSGGLNIVLLHEPNKNAAGVPDGNMTNAGGETDINITFPITIE